MDVYPITSCKALRDAVQRQWLCSMAYKIPGGQDANGTMSADEAKGRFIRLPGRNKKAFAKIIGFKGSRIIIQLVLPGLNGMSAERRFLRPQGTVQVLYGFPVKQKSFPDNEGESAKAD